MNYRVLFAIFAVTVPLAAASYGSHSGGPVSYGMPGGASYGLQELANAASGSQQGDSSVIANAEVQPSAAETARLNQVQAQLQALNANPTYRNMKNSEGIAESLAERDLVSNIREGTLNVVAPNQVNQGVYSSLLVPNGGNHQVIATKQLAPIVVNQPGAPPAHVSSGPASVIRANAVIYKLKPSVIYQREVVNKVPTPLSLNPVYVKVYKPGKKIDAPVAPVVSPHYSQPSYAPSYGSSSGGDSYGSAANVAPIYANPSYGGQASYAPSGY